VDLITKEALPFRLVESENFKAFVGELDPRYKLPDRLKLSETLIPDAYDAKKAEIKAMISKAVAVALTTDMWTSVNNDSYMGVTCHFIDSDFRANSKCLAVSHAPGSHTAELIKTELEKIKKEWGLEGRRIHFVTDSGANVKKAMSLLADTIWRPCFAHTLQLVVNGGINNKQVTDLPKMLASARTIVGHFRRSPAETTELEAAQKQLSLPKHRLQQDVSMRWNSQVIMLDRLVEQRSAVTLVLSNQTAVASLTPQQWSSASDLIASLQPFLDITREMSAARYPTLSMIVPVVDGLKDLLTTSIGGLDVLREIFATAIDTRFGDPYDDAELRAATLVDPRFKAILFSDAQLRKAVESTLDLMMAHVTAATGTSAVGTSATSVVVGASTTPTPTTPDRRIPTATSTDAPKKRSFWDKFDGIAAASPRRQDDVGIPTRSRDSMQHELELYLEEPRIDRLKGNPLEWWRAHQRQYPAVATVARQLLCIPATSVPSERLFSKAGNVITKKRNQLNPLKAQKVIFLMEN